MQHHSHAKCDDCGTRHIPGNFAECIGVLKELHSDAMKEIEKRDNLIAEQGMQLEQINNALDGEEVCDFALSFPIIDKTTRMMQMKDGLAELKAEIEQLKFGHESLPCPRADK